MVKHKTPLLGILLGILVGVLGALSVLFIKDRVAYYERYQFCLKRDFSYIDLNSPLDTREEGVFTYLQFYNLTVCTGGNFTYFMDYNLGCLYGYEDGILTSISLAEYEKNGAYFPVGRRIRTAEEVEVLADLLKSGNMDEVKKKSTYVWQLASGEVFVH